MQDPASQPGPILPVTKRSPVIRRVLLGLSLFVLLIAVLIGGVLVRVRMAPVDLSFARNYVQKALSDPTAGVATTISGLALYMPDFSKPLLIGLRDVKLLGADGDAILGVDEAAISLSIPRLLTGKIAPRRLILKKPFLRIIRTPEQGFQLGFGPEPADRKKEEKQDNILEDVLKYVARPGTERHDAPLASLRGLEIEGANVLVEDHVLGVSWFLPRFDAALESTRQGLDAALKVGLPDVKGQSSYISTSLGYDWVSKDMAVSGDIHNVDMYALAGKIPGLSALQDEDVVLNGQVQAVLDDSFAPRSASISLSSLKGLLVVPGVYTKPLAYDSILFNAVYDDAAKKMNITQAQVIAQGATIDAKGAAVFAGNKISMPLQFEILNLPQPQIEKLWPEALRGDPSEVWLVHHITGGVYKTANASLKLDITHNDSGAWDVAAHDVQAGFSFDNMKVDYRAPMVPVTAAKGRGTFDYDKELLRVTVDQAKVGGLDLKEGKVALTDILTANKGVAHVSAKISGPVKSLLEYADKDPINLGAKVDFDIPHSSGEGDLDISLSLPTIASVQMSDVKLDITGKLRNVSIPNVVKTLPLTDGTLDVAINGDSLRIKGKGSVASAPADIDVLEYLETKDKPYAGQIKASLVADAELRTRLGVNLDSFLEGAVPVDVTYTSYADGKSIADVNAKLMPVRFFAEPFDYEKPAGVDGSASLKVVFDKGVLKEITDLSASAPQFQITKGGLTFSATSGQPEISSGKFGQLVVGETNAAVTFEIAPVTRQIKISLNGPFLDLRPFLANNDDRTDKKYEDPPLVASITVDQMRTADSQTIQKSKMYLDVDADGHFNQLELDATAGKGDIYLRYKPDNSGKRTFRLEAGDAGATLRAFDVYDKIVGGKLVIYAEPIANVYDRNLVGSAEISNFKVVKAPSLAHLLSVMSLGGINDLLNDEGISFSKLEANFDWLYRPKGSVLVLKDGRTSGNSLGLTFDGKFDRSNDMFDVSGTIIPLSGINKIIGSIPLVGDVLTGGTGSLFAATYTVKGSAQNPNISVNPLSVLAPGIIRRILFE